MSDISILGEEQLKVSREQWLSTAASYSRGYILNYARRKEVIADTNAVTTAYIRSAIDLFGADTLLKLVGFQPSYFIHSENGVERFISFLSNTFPTTGTTQNIMACFINYLITLRVQIGDAMLKALEEDMLDKCSVTTENLNDLWNLAYPNNTGVMHADPQIIFAIYLFITEARGLIAVTEHRILQPAIKEQVQGELPLEMTSQRTNPELGKMIDQFYLQGNKQFNY